jgi:hypothetical protein
VPCEKNNDHFVREFTNNLPRLRSFLNERCAITLMTPPKSSVVKLMTPPKSSVVKLMTPPKSSVVKLMTPPKSIPPFWRMLIWAKWGVWGVWVRWVRWAGGVTRLVGNKNSGFFRGFQIWRDTRPTRPRRPTRARRGTKTRRIKKPPQQPQGHYGDQQKDFQDCTIPAFAGRITTTDSVHCSSVMSCPFFSLFSVSGQLI